MTALPQLDLTIGALHGTTPAAFAQSSVSGLFDAGGMYAGYGTTHTRVHQASVWLRSFRGWQIRAGGAGSTAIPVMGYRPDLLSYGEEPSRVGWWEPLRARRSALTQRVLAFRDAGWEIALADEYAEWLPMIMDYRDGEWPVSYCKDRAGGPDHLLMQTACNDVRRLTPEHAIGLARHLGVGGIHLGCKRYMWSDLTREFNPHDDRRGGPLVNPYAEGEFDAHMNRLIRGYINAGLVVVKQENPAGPGGRYDWLDRDLAESGMVFDTGAFVRVA